MFPGKSECKRSLPTNELLRQGGKEACAAGATAISILISAPGNVSPKFGGSITIGNDETFDKQVSVGRERISGAA